MTDWPKLIAWTVGILACAVVWALIVWWLAS